MNFNRTTFVIGAGASKAINPEFGLGIELLNSIISNVNIPPLRDFLKRKLGDEIKLSEFASDLREYTENSDSPSIDQFVSEVHEFPEFMEKRESYSNIAINSIVHYILKYESSILSQEYYESNFSKKSWINPLVDWMKENDFFDNPKNNNYLKIVSFNYDRTIEYLLLKHFADRKKEVYRFIEESIVHVYGDIGSLDENSINHISLGGVDSDLYIFESNRIKLLYNARSNDDVLINKSQHYISTLDNPFYKQLFHSNFAEAKDQQVCFFGFSFDYLNCVQLNLTTTSKNIPKFYANLHPFEFDYGFKFRRKNANYLRKIRTDFNFSYFDAQHFVEEKLGQFNINF